jgi:ankyrin repeat protein
VQVRPPTLTRAYAARKRSDSTCLNVDVALGAADKGHLECVKALVGAGADLNSFKDSRGRTLLMRVPPLLPSLCTDSLRP